MTNEQIADFVKQQHIGVIGYLAPGGKPQSAVVGLVLHDNFIFTFGTSIESRKYENLIANENVSVVIGWTEGKTVQYEGRARLLEGEELQHYKDARAAVKPASVKFDGAASQRHFIIEPTWLRYTDTSQSPWLIQELLF